MFIKISVLYDTNLMQMLHLISFLITYQVAAREKFSPIEWKFSKTHSTNQMFNDTNEIVHGFWSALTFVQLHVTCVKEGNKKNRINRRSACYSIFWHKKLPSARTLRARVFTAHFQFARSIQITVVSTNTQFYFSSKENICQMNGELSGFHWLRQKSISCDNV